jgi:dolichol kinase
MDKNLNTSGDSYPGKGLKKYEIWIIIAIISALIIFAISGRYFVLLTFLLLAFLGNRFNLKEYRGTPTKFVSPVDAEIKARTKRNIALASGLLLFVILVFVTMVSRGELPNAV